MEATGKSWNNHQGITQRSSEYLESFTWGSRTTLQESRVYQVSSLVSVIIQYHFTSCNESDIIL